MIKRKYETQTIAGIRFYRTKCGVMQTTKVGDLFCRNCEYCVSHDTGKRIIECSNPVSEPIQEDILAKRAIHKKKRA